MRERSEGIGATLRLKSRIGAGTEVELTLPAPVAFEIRPTGVLLGWLPWMHKEKYQDRPGREK
jgi:hypothetical protein